ncbi:MAG TPA: hypothetical protein VNU68_22350 [Verrucomicrobiae bacterium]|nr:hypothetical protein [Verrucomicrobiae bacterium]
MLGYGLRSERFFKSSIFLLADGFAVAQTILNEENLIAGEQVNVTSGTASDVLNRPTTAAQGLRE